LAASSFFRDIIDAQGFLISTLLVKLAGALF
jgi:hypothetical protein